MVRIDDDKKKKGQKKNTSGTREMDLATGKISATGKTYDTSNFKSTSEALQMAKANSKKDCSTTTVINKNKSGTRGMQHVFKCGKKVSSTIIEYGKKNK